MVQRQKIYLTSTFFTKASICKRPQNLNAASPLFFYSVFNAFLGLVSLVCFAPCKVLRFPVCLILSGDGTKLAFRYLMSILDKLLGNLFTAQGQRGRQMTPTCLHTATFPSTGKEILHVVSYLAYINENILVIFGSVQL